MNEKIALKILGIKKTTDFDQIKKRYRKLVLKEHPDKNPEVGSDKKFIQIFYAFHYLRTKNKNSLEFEKNLEKLIYDLQKVFLHWKESEYDNALKVINIMISKFEENDELFYVKGMILIQLNKYQNALNCFEHIEEFKSDSSLWNNIAYCYSKLENYEKILICCDKMIEIESNNASKWWYNKAICYYKLKNLEKSIEYFDKVIKLNPHDKDAKELRDRTIKKLEHK